MAFHDDVFPESISYGSRGGPGFRTQIIPLDSGQEKRTSLWSEPRHSYNVAYGVKRYTDLSTLKDFYIARYGAAHSFRYKDWADYNTTPAGFGGASDSREGGETPAFDDQIIGTGDGSNKTFQLVKKYTSGNETRSRAITKPVSGTVKIGVNGVEQSSGFSVDHSTGIVTFTTAPTTGHDVTWGGEFHVHARFGEVSDEVFEMTAESFGHGSMRGIDVVEIMASDPLTEEFYFGGAVVETLSGARAITEPEGRVWSLDPDGADRDVNLPNAEADWPAGGPWFYIHNSSGGGFSLNVRHDGNLVVSVAAGETATILLSISGSTSTWLGFK